MLNQISDGRRRRRTHSAEFKAQVVASCRQAGVSIAAVTMASGVNANLARRWVVTAEQGANGSGGSGRLLADVSCVAPPPAFVPVQQEAVALVTRLDDVAVMREPVQQRRGHLRVAEHRRPLGEVQVGRDHHAGVLVQPTQQMEQQGTAGLAERQVSQLGAHEIYRIERAGVLNAEADCDRLVGIDGSVRVATIRRHAGRTGVH